MSDQDKITEFEEGIGKGQPATLEEFRAEVRNAYMDRSRQIYFILKKLKQLYPDVDANRVIREAFWDFGVYQGEKIAEKSGGADQGPIEVLLGQTSKGSMAVFDQEIKELGENRAVKIFHSCPHADALKELGATDEEITAFCRDMLSACDFGIYEHFKKLDIDFLTTVADLKGQGCQMIITRKEEEPK